MTENPGNKKSKKEEASISYNLGVSFALKRKRVLIVDCDLRHGSSSMFVECQRMDLLIILPEI